MGYYTGKLMGMQAEAVSGIVTDGLKLYLDASNPASYPGSGTAWSDLSGNNNNGVLLNGVLYDSVNGGRLIFDGVDDSVQVASASSLNISTNITIAGWLYFDTLVGNADIICKQGTPFPNYPGVYEFRRLGAKLNFEWEPLQSTSSARDLIANTWTHICAVKNLSTNTVIFYINGVAENPISFTSYTPSTGAYNEPVRIMRRKDSQLCKGKVGEIEIYNRALTAEEITQNFNATKSKYGL